MDILKKLFHRSKRPDNTAPQKVQGDNPNRQVLTVCRQAGFPEAHIRKALVDLNGINVKKLANGVGVTTVYGALKGENAHQVARVILADALGLRVEELFHDQRSEAAAV